MILIKRSVLGILTFLSLFLFFYKSSGKFKKSVIAGFAAMTILTSPTSTSAAGQADAFTPQNQQHQSRPQKGQGIFGRNSNKGPNPNNEGSGPGKSNGDGSDGDDGGIPTYPKTESIEETQSHLSNIEELINKLEEDSESEIETESDISSAEQLQVDESYKSN